MNRAGKSFPCRNARVSPYTLPALGSSAWSPRIPDTKLSPTPSTPYVVRNATNEGGSDISSACSSAATSAIDAGPAIQIPLVPLRRAASRSETVRIRIPDLGAHAWLQLELHAPFVRGSRRRHLKRAA